VASEASQGEWTALCGQSCGAIYHVIPGKQDARRHCEEVAAARLDKLRRVTIHQAAAVAIANSCQFIPKVCVMKLTSSYLRSHLRYRRIMVLVLVLVSLTHAFALDESALGQDAADQPAVGDRYDFDARVGKLWEKVAKQYAKGHLSEAFGTVKEILQLGRGRPADQNQSVAATLYWLALMQSRGSDASDARRTAEELFLKTLKAQKNLWRRQRSDCACLPQS